DIIPDQTAQMNVIEDQVIEKLSATASAPAFRDSILPRACRAYVHAFYAVCPQHIGNLLAKLGITIQDRVAVRTGFRKGFSQLLHYPGAGWVFRNVEMENLASIVHGEEVHGSDDFAVIAQESSPEVPCLLGRRQAPDVARNCALRDLEAELEKFTMNRRSPPVEILLHHPLDERSSRGIDLWPAKALWARAKAPEQPKASPMPGDNGFRFEHD